MGEEGFEPSQYRDIDFTGLHTSPSVPLTRGIPLAIIGRTVTQYDRYATVLRSPAEPVMVDLASRLAPGE